MKASFTRLEAPAEEVESLNRPTPGDVRIPGGAGVALALRKLASLPVAPPLGAIRQAVDRAFPGWLELPLSQAAKPLCDALSAPGMFPVRAWLVDLVVGETGFSTVVPDAYRAYRPMVADGITLFLRGLPPERFATLLLEQLSTPPEVSPAERLAVLARRFPTLQKLGQVVARNPHFDEGFRRFLRTLEEGIHFPEGAAWIRGLRDSPGMEGLRWGRELLAEASVALVVAGRRGADGEALVAKGIKPGLRESLEEELVLMDSVATHYEVHRRDYCLPHFRFVESCREVVAALRMEMDLEQEQANLGAAADAFRWSRVAVPRLHPESSASFTVMERIRGQPLMEADLTRAERRALARDLFDALVLDPLCSRRDQSLFHGDPHGGNLMVQRNHQGLPRAVVLDWSQCGRLDHRERDALVRLLAAWMRGDARAVVAQARCLHRGSSWCDGLEERVQAAAVSCSPEANGDTLFASGLSLIDRLAREGVSFGRDALLYRKAAFTLQGVLGELDPGFAPDLLLANRTWWVASMVA